MRKSYPNDDAIVGISLKRDKVWLMVECSGCGEARRIRYDGWSRHGKGRNLCRSCAQLSENHHSYAGGGKF